MTVFSGRHIGISARELPDMLKTIGAPSLDALIRETVPDSIRIKSELPLPAALSEREYLDHIRGLAAENRIYRSYLGLGYHGTITPSVILRNVFENPGWYTQYTPYQAEISQGRLEALLNFQTMVMDLTGFPLANASLLDEGTAAAEAMTMFHRLRPNEKKTADTFLVDVQTFPQTRSILETRAEPLGIKIADLSDASLNAADTYGILIQYPAADGGVHDISAIIATAKKNGIKVVLACDLMSLVLLKSPGELGADCAVGNSQRFGVPMGYGGPHAAFFATADEYKRDVPGRIIGVSVDARGKIAYRMALQTREQHIRREKATSNICTAQALLAIMASMYAVYHGPEGLKAIATLIHQNARELAEKLSAAGFSPDHASFFDTLHISATASEKKEITARAEKLKINFRSTEKGLCIALDETVTAADLKDIISCFAGIRKEGKSAKAAIAPALIRTSEILTHPVFHENRSETEMMRYIRRLENKDLSLVTSMIPLGSCTMKLNAASEMIPVSWPEFGALHPFAPVEQAAGYQKIFRSLEKFLCEITGFQAASLQPNSGAQGEYAGLMVIRKYHQANKGENRNVALIPSSAHGTNPASAAMAGMEIIVVKCDDNGNIDVADLREKALKHKERLSCLMVTYPSTHGVFEEQIREICRIIHENGGLVYMDGANMNAQVGLTSPGEIGADVCHLNLHKTFAIPHGGGGPGMGPICVNQKLAPYLPGHPVVEPGKISSPMGAVSAAPWGSASILLISYSYILMLGKDGVKQSTEYAILNANYLKALLEKDFPVLYQGSKGRVAHELILDFRDLFKGSNLTVEDVAKRLMDYGFHAPTMSWPVAGTIMVEPTESESKAELDRFAEALLTIGKEIKEVLSGSYPADANVLKKAPHAAEAVLSDNWDLPYGREKAAFPLPWVRSRKFWPSVSRIDNVHGDRNLVCACPPMEAYSNA